MVSKICFLLYVFANYRRGGTRAFENKTTGLHNLKTDDYVSRYEVVRSGLSTESDGYLRYARIGYTELLKCKRAGTCRLLDDLIKARFVEMFGDENNSKNWDVVNVEEVADVQVGVVIKPSQYYTDKSEGVRTFRSLNIGAGFIKDIDWVYFTKEGHQKNSKSILKKDDLLIVRSGAPGTACVVTEEYAGCNAVDIIIAHPDCKKVNPYYLCTFTNMPHGKKQIDEGLAGQLNSILMLENIINYN